MILSESSLFASPTVVFARPNLVSRAAAAPSASPRAAAALSRFRNVSKSSRTLKEAAVSRASRADDDDDEEEEEEKVFR